jgi:hypothetical protein
MERGVRRSKCRGYRVYSILRSHKLKSHMWTINDPGPQTRILPLDLIFKMDLINLP